MLVLSRRVGERLLIGDDIVITIIDVRNDGVRVGIEAPRETRIHRAEVFEAVSRSNQQATEARDDDVAALQRFLVPGRRPGAPGAAAPEGGPARSEGSDRPGPSTAV